MFNAISWSQYGLAVGLLLVAYYTYVLAVYYWPEISALVKGRLAVGKPRPAGPRKLAPGAAATLRGASPLIVPSLVVVAPAYPRVEEEEPPTDDESALPDTEDLFAGDEADTQKQVAVAKADDVAQEAKLEISQPRELVETSCLIDVVELSAFLDQVESGEFTPEKVHEAPAALENTALLQDIFTASLARRRASLAVLEDA